MLQTGEKDEHVSRDGIVEEPLPPEALARDVIEQSVQVEEDAELVGEEPIPVGDAKNRIGNTVNSPNTNYLNKRSPRSAHVIDNDHQGLSVVAWSHYHHINASEGPPER